MGISRFSSIWFRYIIIRTCVLMGRYRKKSKNRINKKNSLVRHYIQCFKNFCINFENEGLELTTEFEIF